MSRKNRPVVLRTYVAPPLAEVVLRAADEEGRSTSDWLQHIRDVSTQCWHLPPRDWIRFTGGRRFARSEAARSDRAWHDRAAKPPEAGSDRRPCSRSSRST